MKPYKVYRNGRLFDVVYFTNGTPPETAKKKLVDEDKYPENIEVRHFTTIRERIK